jgi:hypothetical protein
LIPGGAYLDRHRKPGVVQSVAAPPAELGENPNSAGGQNETRYAFFGDKKRLAVDRGDGKVQIYDTGNHLISGVQQAQCGNDRKVIFTSQDGEVDLEKLRRV